MADIKTSGTSSEAAVQAEKEIQLARQQAEMKVGEALFREASRKITEQREAIQDHDKDTKQTQPKDTAQLSDLPLRPLTSETGTADENLKWVLEMAGKDWEAFSQWQPEHGLPLPTQLRELSALYLNLLEAALKYAQGEHLVRQMERLDSLLAQKLSIIMEENLEQLTALLEQTGRTATLDSIRSSLYRQTAGRTLSPQAAHRLFAQETSVRQGNANLFTPAGNTKPFTPAASSSLFSSGKSAADGLSPEQDAPLRQAYSRQRSAVSSSFSGEGMIYQSSRKQNLRFQQVYHGQQNSWKEQIRQRKEIINNARKGIAENTFRQPGLVSCSGKELEMANRFAAHLNGRGNLFQNPDISARNDEIIGLLAAMMSIKGQVYTMETGESSFLSLSLQHAIEKIIDHYLSQKGITNVYYHTLALYKKMKNPQKAIQAGQDYAYERFREKQKNPVYQKSAPYSREAGFFRTLPKNLSPEKEYALGTNILKKDWENFLRTMGKTQKDSYLSRAEKYSPWGIFIEPETNPAGSKGTIIKALLGIVAIVLIGSFIVYFFGAGIW